MEGVHFNLVVKLLNDRYGIQTRGGCSCAGTYGHFLLNVDQQTSYAIKNQILEGCLLKSPVGFACLYTTTNKELDFICNALKKLCHHIDEWSKDYTYDISKNDYVHKTITPVEKNLLPTGFACKFVLYLHLFIK